MKLELIFTGKHKNSALFTKRSGKDGMFVSVSDGELTTELLESGVYSLDFEVDHAIPNLNSLGDATGWLVRGNLTGKPEFLRTISGKPLHFDVQERKTKLIEWLTAIDE